MADNDSHIPIRGLKGINQSLLENISAETEESFVATESFDEMADNDSHIPIRGLKGINQSLLENISAETEETFGTTVSLDDLADNDSHIPIDGLTDGRERNEDLSSDDAVERPWKRRKTE
ncbi:hypothetical protein AVEN_85374-1 [Araneus ventricosus]|uniref:Uncharacterized protein n=1 Tax=Araneus ventricosus TaxID=182803 RepID=A0A4Y2DXU4_ARAVE|nr:hypothetical protein AVEN_85374-1 [Araneus ventricosus]